MAISNAVVIHKSVLDYKTNGWKISQQQITYTTSYGRTWTFKMQDGGPFTVSANSGQAQDIAFCLSNSSENNAKLQCVTDYQQNAHGFEAYGTGSLTRDGSTNWQTKEWYSSNYVFGVRNGSDFNIVESEFITNIPIFETEAQALGYLNGTVPITDAINSIQSDVPDGEDFEIINPWTHGTWTEYGHTESGTTTFRNVRGKLVNGTFALYPITFSSGDSALKYGISFSNDVEFYGLQYSLDNVTWIDTNTFPFEFFYRERTKELGTFDYGLTCSNAHIPEFENQSDADGYNAGTVDILNATNWNEISSSYTPINTTGDVDDASTMGQVYTRAFFSQQYICSESALQQISNALYDTNPSGMFENIKKGLEMYGEDVIEAVQGCMFFPINLNNVFTSVQNQSYIYFGGYKFDLSDGVTVNKILYPNGYYDFGTFDLKPTFKNFRDYSPFSRLFCYLAYVGWVELDIARYINKTVTIRYYFDTRTGGCLACLFAGATLVDYFNGQCGVQMPVTLTSFSQYANAQIQTLLGGGKTPNGTGGAVGEMVSSGAKGVMDGLAETGTIGLGAMAVGGIGAAAGIQTTKTLYGLTQNNINNFNKTKGASTSMLNQYLPQECCFMFEIQDADITPNELSLLGYPSNASGQLQEFSGYLEVDVVNLVCPYASDTEKAEIVKQLQNGVYI